MKKKTGGHESKDASIVNGFNKRPWTRFDPVTGKILPKEGTVAIKKATAEAKKIAPKSDLDAAYQMLEDMRSVYQHGGGGHKTGRARLRKLMESDKEFMGMVKELMKIETALLSARIRKEGVGPGEGGQGVLVILKGLDTDTDLLKAAGAEGPIDLKRLEHSMDPSAGNYEEERVEKEESLPETPQEG